MNSGQQACYPDELEDWLRQLGLVKFLPEAIRWCDEQGAIFLEEVVENTAELAKALNLSDEEVTRIVTESQQASNAVCSRHGIQGNNLTLKAASTLISGSSVSSGDEDGLQKQAQAKANLSRILTFTAAVQSFKRCRTRTPPIPDEAAQAISRTATCCVEGPLATVFGALSCPSQTLCMEEVGHKEAQLSLKKGEGVLGATSISGTKPPTNSTRTSAIHRVDTVTGDVASASNRERLVDEVHKDDLRTVTIDEGQTGSVFALEAGGHKIAVFKPEQGEHFRRRGMETGKGAVREEVAYLVDRLSGSKASVPVTSRASVEVAGKSTDGSVQAFISDAVGFIEDWGMPRQLDDARAMVPQEIAEAVALLDMRVFNTDRHGANLLLLRQEKPHGLGPIDHGCCLPAWWALGEASFEAWFAWPQLRCEPSQAARALAQLSYEKLPQICDQARVVGLEDAGIITLQLCTLLVFIAISEIGISCAALAALMLRHSEELSWLESQVLKAAGGAGVACCIEDDDIGDQQILLKGSPDSLKVEPFLKALETAFRAEVKEAAAVCGAKAYPPVVPL